jgi:arylsulfatase A-like enzyme
MVAAASPQDPPNVVVILTDQERVPMHWPAALAGELMPSWARLQAHGLTFHRAYASASQCSPSRACMVTGEYAPANGMPSLPLTGMPSLPSLPNLASVLSAAGYDVVWKGKWHLNYPVDYPTGSKPSDEVWTDADITAMQTRYGFSGWNPPDSGNDAGVYGTAGAPSMGGGTFDNDGRTVLGVTHAGQTPGVTGAVGAVEYLRSVAGAPAAERKPFALFVSLVNPHDITFFPSGWSEGGYTAEQFGDVDVELPPNADDALTTKPSVQLAYRNAIDGVAPLAADPGDGATAEQYVKFYAHVHRVVEPHITAVLDELDRHDLTGSTIVVRTSDHGEAGLSHGLREKAYSAYEEMIHVPLVISNPVLFPAPRETDALWTHVDLLPTLADLAGAQPVGVGRSQLPVLRDPTTSVHDDVLFAFDDDFVLPFDQPRGRLRALRDRRWTYAVYFDATCSAFEYELYDNDADPLQLDNLVFDPDDEVRPIWRDLHSRLLARLASTRALDLSIVFPPDPSAPTVSA